MGYSKRISKEQRKAIKSARKQVKTVDVRETQKQLHAVSRYGK